MLKKEIILTPMTSVGSCRALVGENSIQVKSYGIAGCLKAWLTRDDGDALEIGNLVSGTIERTVDTAPYNGVLVTQSGRQMFYGKFREVSAAEEKKPEKAAEECEDAPPCEISEEEPPLPEETIETPAKEIPVPPSCEPLSPPMRPAVFSFDDGYQWREISDRAYPSDSKAIRYILSHRSFYNAFMTHGRYFYGENGDKAAVAVECDIKNEPHPLPLLTAYTVFRDGYMIISADTRSGNFCVYEY